LSHTTDGSICSAVRCTGYAGAVALLDRSLNEGIDVTNVQWDTFRHFM
jgi:hypothetical protein